MSTRRFEYNDDKSNKFWEISFEGNSYTVHFGRVGTSGQSKAKSFDSREAMEKDANKLIAQKTKKGYLEHKAKSVEDADTLPAGQLRKLLGGLCSTEADEEILQKLCNGVVRIDDNLIVFEDDCECEYDAGGTIVYQEDIPRSFSEIKQVVSSLCWDGGGPEVGYAIDDDGMPAADDWLFGELRYDSPQECERVEAAGKVIASFLAGQNGLFFDPTAKLSNGEPGLAFVSHEGGGWVSVKSAANLNYSQILLRMLADAMLETSYITEIYF